MPNNWVTWEKAKEMAMVADKNKNTRSSVAPSRIYIFFL